MGNQVAPFTGAWIEIFPARGYKKNCHGVAPFTGAWIEIPKSPHEVSRTEVAPFTGAWIEIMVG